jgi:hypothetical protein
MASARSATEQTQGIVVHNFYGDPEIILTRMDGAAIDLPTRSAYLLMVEGDESAQIRFFEQADEENWAVSSWRGETLGDLWGQVDQTIIETGAGPSTAGRVKSLLEQTVPLELEGVVPPPVSARAAFAHPLRGHGANEFLRATTALF